MSKEIPPNKIAALATGGAPSMTEIHSGFVTKLNKNILE